MESYEQEFLNEVTAKLASVEANMISLKVEGDDQECLLEVVRKHLSIASIRLHRLKELREGKA